MSSVALSVNVLRRQAVVWVDGFHCVARGIRVHYVVDVFQTTIKMLECAISAKVMLMLLG